MSLRRPRYVWAAYVWSSGMVALGLLVVSGATGADVPGPNCTTECHQEIRDRPVLHGPARTNCSACHVGVGNPDDHKFAFVVAEDRLCQKCHQLPHREISHAPVMAGQCRECHDPHGSRYQSLLVADPRRDLCAKCHRMNFNDAAFVHGPVAVGACVVCHDAHGSNEPGLLVRESNTLCLECHPEAEAPTGAGVHTHAAISQGCTQCHDAHSSEHQYQLHATAPALCLECHRDVLDRIIDDSAIVHGAITAEGGCSVCHEPHYSRSASLVRRNELETCLECHDQPVQSQEGDVIADMAALFAANPDKHGPVREGACTACHAPHAGEKFRMLTQEYPPEFYAPFELDTFRLCFTCHISELVLEPSGKGLTNFRHGDQNLHWLHVNQRKGRTCRACHEVHASKRPAHIRDAVPFGNGGWMLEINFEQTGQGGRCAPACHAPKVYIRSDEVQPPPPHSPGEVQ